MEAIVKFPYDKEQDDELSLKIGDVVTNITTVEEGWCEGTVNGVTGLFPSNFIEFREAKPEPVLPDVPKMRAETTEASRSRRAKVAFSYLAENTDELTLPVGEIVEVIDEEEEGWWRGKLNGKEGVFPSNFVEVIKEEPEPPPPTYNNLPPQTAMPPNRPPGGRPPSGVPMPGFGGINPSELKQKLKPVSAAPPAPSHGNEPQPVKTNPGLPPPKTEQLQKAKVMFKYDADQDDEITVKEGDIVDVLKMETDQEGWVLIRLNNKQGMVPENFISIMKQQPPPQAERDIKPPEDNPPLPPKVQNPNVGLPARARPPPPTIPKNTRPPVELPPKLPAKQPEPEPVQQQPELPAKEPPQPTVELDIPRQDILDNTKAKDKPKRTARPPSRNTSGVDISEDNVDNHQPAPTTKAPWQEELKSRKPKPTPPIPSAGAPPTATKPAPFTRPKPAAKVIKPAKVPEPEPQKPDPPKPESQKREPPTPEPQKPSTPPVTPTPAPAPILKPTPPTGGPSRPLPPKTTKAEETKPVEVASNAEQNSSAWKEAFQQLQEQFTKFQNDLRQEMQKEIDILAKDLDNERKKTAQMEIDIDRLKKSRDFRDNI